MNINVELSKVIDKWIRSGVNSHDVLDKLTSLLTSTIHTLSNGNHETLEQAFDIMRKQWAILEESFGDKKN